MVLYPLALVNPTEMATTSAGSPRRGAEERDQSCHPLSTWVEGQAACGKSQTRAVLHRKEVDGGGMVQDCRPEGGTQPVVTQSHRKRVSLLEHVSQAL